MKSKLKKTKRFWEPYKLLLGDKVAQKYIDRAERIYNKHRAKSSTPARGESEGK